MHNEISNLTKEVVMLESKKLHKLLDRLEQSGVPVNRVALDRKFNLVISGIVTEGIDIAVFVRLAELITTFADQKGFICELKGIVVFPIILDRSIYSRENFVTHKRRDSAYFVGKNIDVEVWKRARKPRRLNLAIETLKSSIQAIPDKHLSPKNKLALSSIVETVSKEF